MVPLGICTSWYLLKDYEDEDLSEDEDEDLSDGHHIEYNILGVLSHARSLKLVAPLREQSPILEELCVELREKECEYCKEKAPPFSYSYGEILPFKCHRLKTVKIKCGERDERFIALVKLFFKISVCIEKFDLDRWPGKGMPHWAERGGLQAPQAQSCEGSSPPLPVTQRRLGTALAPTAAFVTDGDGDGTDSRSNRPELTGDRFGLMLPPSLDLGPPHPCLCHSAWQVTFLVTPKATGFVDYSTVNNGCERSRLALSSIL
ncbi:hypothetical protein OsI_32278 [Oryza sativa Indica Group]|uniref:Uncharacterized protein n=1 Tax=Oryza sativa subsp. indica TaxID=39946 RepID=B8BE45_ORYSI|nr:hypothetical protein OsI_32278 [Oryza sativa Indica Group]